MKNQHKNRKELYQGFTLLTTLIILSAIILTVITSGMLLARNNQYAVNNIGHQMKLKYAAESCAEKAFILIQNDEIPDQQIELNTDGYTCQAEVSSSDTDNYTVLVTSRYENSSYTANIALQVINENIDVLAWDEN